MHHPNIVHRAPCRGATTNNKNNDDDSMLVKGYRNDGPFMPLLPPPSPPPSPLDSEQHYSSTARHTNLFPSNYEAWNRTHRELFLVFLQVLLEYLKHANEEELRRDVKETIAQCRSNFIVRRTQRQQQRRQRQPRSSIPLMANLYHRLCDVVPSETWLQAESYLHRYVQWLVGQTTSRHHHQDQQKSTVARSTSREPSTDSAAASIEEEHGALSS
jgi:hypothetical protein